MARRVHGAPAVDWIGAYLLEDLGPGDITTDALFEPAATGSARIVARARTVVAGGQHAAEVFRRLGATAEQVVQDGKWADAGATVLRVTGPTRAILSGERLALNVVGRMSGIATLTRECVEVLAKACATTMVAGTRKTTPGFRAFEKEAIATGGGERHRMGLWDEAMLKDNHLEAWAGRGLAKAAAADVGRAVARVVAANPLRVVCCEVESLAHAQAAADAGAAWLLIDNQPPATGEAWAREVRLRHPAVRVEASGGITPATVGAFGWADRVSLGWLTQKAQAADMSMEWGA
ncbi:MAG: carboxylating nicotinate-nucleotide diphosphorylase [bacterium]